MIDVDDIPKVISKSRPNLKPNSVRQYEIQLNKLKSLFESDNYDFLKNINSVKDKLKDLHYTSVRNMYNAIIILLMALNDNNKYDKLIKEYGDLRDELNTKYEEQVKSKKLTEKEEKNFAKIEDIEDMISKLTTEIKTYKKKTSLNKMEVSKLRAWILFNMLIRIPTRNDASNMKYISQKSYKSLSDEDKKNNNYLVNERNNMKFIYNVYKTSKKWGENVIPVPQDLKPMLRLYIKLMDYKVGDNIFPMSRNAISQLLTKTSKQYLNKNISSSMIRKIYLTEKYGNINEEMKKDAKMLGHSVQTQQKVYVKNDE